MNPSSLDWSIQGALSSLFPPFEATAPTVLSQLFRTIDERFQGDALQCLLDFLIPAKHILESVQQAACAAYSDVVFRCEGWPLCLRDRVVIQLAPINPLLLRPGDFYLQVEPFGDQAARIVLKSLLAQGEGLLEQAGVGSHAEALEETPILETSYPCIFTEAWLREVNEGRHGVPLGTCVLSSDQGVVKVPWAEIAKPEFLDRPKSRVPSASMSSLPTGMVVQDVQMEASAPPSPGSQSSVQSELSSLTMETVILPAKDGIAVSLRLTGGNNSKPVKVDHGMAVNNPSGKPVGWVSPNTWDTRHKWEMEGEYVDLVEFNKEKEALALSKPTAPKGLPLQGLRPVRPAPPAPKRDHPPQGGPLKLPGDLCAPYSKGVPLTLDLESKNRHRESYLAALMNPVCFGGSLAPLEETGADVEEPCLSAEGGCGPGGPAQTAQACLAGCPSQTTPEGESSPKPRQAGPPGQPWGPANCGGHPTNAGAPLQPPLLQHCHQPDSAGGREGLQRGVHGVQKFPKTQMLRKLGQPCKPPLDVRLACQGSSETEGQQQQQTPLWHQDPCQAKDHRAPLQSQTPHQAAGPQPASPTKSPALPYPVPGVEGHCPNSRAVTQGAPETLAQAEVPRLWGKGRAKQHSLSSVSDSARECLQAHKMPSRSLSDVCPEVIPTIRVIQNKKTTAFGLVSPKMDRKAQSKQSKKDVYQSEPGTPQAPDRKLQPHPTDQPPAAQGKHPVAGPRSSASPLFKPLHPDSITLLPLGLACLPGSRDRAGRAVLEVHGDRKGWTCPLVTSVELCKLLLYLHSIPRKEVRDLGLTLVVDARRVPPPPVLYKSLLMIQEQALHAVHGIVVLVDKELNPRPDRHTGLQMDIITSLKALHKIVDGQQLTSDLGGTFLYKHSDWLHFHQKMAVFMTDLQGAATLLQKAIKKLDSVRKMDTVKDVKACIEEQRSSMKEVLEDTRLVTLQREGGAILARMRKEEFRFALSEDYRDAMEAVRSLYNQVEEKVHSLVMRSNQSLQHLDYLLQLRTMEDKITWIREWFATEEQSWLREVSSAEDRLDTVEQRLQHLTCSLSKAKEWKVEAEGLVQEADKIHRASYPEAEVFRALVTTLNTDLAERLSRAEQSQAVLETTARLYRFCEQAMALAKECEQCLEHVGSACYPHRANAGAVRAFEERFRSFSAERFQEAKADALALGGPVGMKMWAAAWAHCQDVSGRLQGRLKASDEGQASLRGAEGPGAAEATSPPHSPSAPAAVPLAASDTPTLEYRECDRRGSSMGLAESRDSRARQSEEATVTCFNLHFKPEGKGKRAANAPAVAHKLSNDLKAPQPPASTENQARANPPLTCPAETAEVPMAPSSPGKASADFVTLQNEIEQKISTPPLPSATETQGHAGQCSSGGASSSAPLATARWWRGSREQHSHSEDDLRRMEEPADRPPCHRALGRSHSEGSCVSSARSSRHTDAASTCTSTCAVYGSQAGSHAAASHHHPHHHPHHHLSHSSQLTPHTPRRGSEEQRLWPEAHSHPHPHTETQASSSPATEAGSRLQSPRTGGTAAAEESSNILKLQRIMEELLLTEREYVRALAYVTEHYFPQLERADVPQDLRGQRGSIFGNLEKLRDFHQHHFLQELELCLREPFLVGRCFLKHKENFSLYALYSKNKPRSDNLLKHHGQFFKQKQLELGDKMDLSSYLLKPVQRISKYSLLLQDVVRECGAGPARGQERAEVQAALEVIQFQLRHGNNLLAMDDIQDCDVNLKEQGQLIRQDEFLVSFRKKKCYRHIFLFQDLILFSKTKKTEVGNDVYIYKQSFKTSDIGMTHNCGDSGLCFEIWFRRRKSQETYILQAASVELKEGWTRDLERILWEQAIHNREIRMQERVFMGIGYKPFMDIQPSEAAISNRAINCALAGRECKAAGPGLPCSQGRFPALRPNSVRRTSSSGSHSSSSSSSSGRGSMSPVGGYLCPISSPPVVGLAGLSLSPPGVLEEDDLDQEQRNHHILVDSSESSGESVSGFSSSGRSCLSVIGGEVEESSSEGPDQRTKASAVQKGPQEPTDQPALPSTPASHTRDQPLSKVKEVNITGKSTEV
ncbi:quattro [Alosa sapidissima]|uniref:quattro n=1 Tax=Alosa sapidissima TaxID=34773 RepID=UPI001C07F2B8|nr:quattro [Alosa sapidissima]